VITLHSDKTCEQVNDLLKKQVKSISLLRLLFTSVRSWDDSWGLFFPYNRDLVGISLVGEIKNNKFWVVMPDWSMWRIFPYRFFFAKVIPKDNGTMIAGKFRFHPTKYYIPYLIGCIIFFSRSFILTPIFFISTTIMILLFLIMNFIIGGLYGVKFEEQTLEHIKDLIGRLEAELPEESENV